MAEREPGPDPGRVCEVIVVGNDGRERRGSGYRVATVNVLTAEHVVRDARQIRLRFEAEREDEWVVGAEVTWSDSDEDVALLTMYAPPDVVGFVDYGQVPRRHASPRGVAVGFPLFKLRDDPSRPGVDGRRPRYRDSHQADGTIKPLSNRKRGTLEFTVDTRLGPEDASGPSPWEGMSGAALWCDGALVGIVAEHEGVGVLTAHRIERVISSASSEIRSRLHQMIGLALTPDDLREVGVAIDVVERELRAVPYPPEAYVAHPYSLLEGPLIGRRQELDDLDAWIDAGDSPVYCVVAIGGMGKSAATWKWFNDSQTGPGGLPWDGRMWWSFYEAGATFERFVVSALMYVTGSRERDVMALRPGEREVTLLRELHRRRFLLVLDGLERALIAYADPAALSRAEQPGHEVGGDRLARRPRGMADPHGDPFLTRLTDVPGSRVVVTTRLRPHAFETRSMLPLSGVHVSEFTGLPRQGAEEVLTANGVAFGADQMLDALASVDFHPLITLTLAAEVAGYRPAPGDFPRWNADHPDFEPAALDLVQRKTHILEIALRGLDPREIETMSVIAAFSSPAAFDQLLAILKDRRAVRDADDLGDALAELDDRALIGWDRVTNRYDMHPIIRGAAMQHLRESGRRETDVYGSLRDYFAAVPVVDSVESWNDLLSVVELFRSTIRTELFDEALDIYLERLHEPLRRLGLWFRVAELLAEFVDEASGDVTGLRRPDQRAFVLHEMALALDQVGEPGNAVCFSGRAIDLSREIAEPVNVVVGSCGLADVELAVGHVADAAAHAVGALLESRRLGRADLEALSSRVLGSALSISGGRWPGRPVGDAAEVCLRRAVDILVRGRNRPGEIAAARLALTEHLQRVGRFDQARPELRSATSAAVESGVEPLRRRAQMLELASRWQAGDAVGAHDGALELVAWARERTDARLEADALILLLRCLEIDGDLGDSASIAGQLVDLAQRAPFPFAEAEERLHRARVARREGQSGEAIEAARAALRLSWPDPHAWFGYRAGRDAAIGLLATLGDRHVPEYDVVPDRAPPWADGVELDPDDGGDAHQTTGGRAPDER